MTEAKIILTGDEGPLRRSLAAARDNLNTFGNEALEPFAKLRDTLGNIGNIMAGIGVVKLTQLADDAALIQARLKDVAGSFTAAQKAQEQLYAASQRLAVSYSDLAGSFSKMLPAVKQMGGGANEAVRLAEILAVTARLAGASTEEASASAQQFAQALGSGVLQGDELKSILENNNTLARALADGLGVTVGELRKLGSEGKLTSDKVAQALLGQYDAIEARSSGLPATVGGAWLQVTNAFEQFVAAANDGTGVFSGLSAVMSGLARLIDAVRVSLSSTSSEADKLGKNNSIKAWGESVGAIFAYVVDLGRAVYESIALVGKQLAALAAAGVAVAHGEFEQASAIMRAYEEDFTASWNRIKSLTTGGEGSTLQSYALNTGQSAPATTSTAKLRSTASTKDKKKKGEGDDGTMSLLEAKLADEKAALVKSNQLLDQAREYELRYWSEVLTTAKLNETEKASIKKKIATLKLDIAKDEAKTQQELDKQGVDTWRELELLKLEGARIAAKALHDQDQISKKQLIDREIEFEERRLQIQLEFLRRKQDLLPANDLAGRAAISGEMSVEGSRSQNTQATLGADRAKASGGIDVQGLTDSMTSSVANGFSAMLTKAKSWQASMLDIYKSIRDAFIKQVVTEPLQAQLSAWAKQLAMKLGFLAQENTAQAASSATTADTKVGEATAVASANAVEAGTGAAASQASIPFAGPVLAVAAMAAIFGAVMAMTGSMKSASRGYDIPSGVNPMTQLHEEEMVLPKDIANPLRNMVNGQGPATGEGGQTQVVLKGASAGEFFIAHRSELVSVLKGLRRDFRVGT
jgi:tape measure domain-containing protein